MPSSLGEARGKITIDTRDVKAAEGRVKQASQQMNKALSAIGIGFGLETVRRLGDMAFQLAETAAQAEATRASFDALSTSVGQDADLMLSAMKTASKGMVSEANLILAANRAMLLGVARTGEELGEMLEAARVLGQAMGKDVSSSFNDLVLGLGRLSPLILDNLGIANEGEQMFENYAKSVGRTADSLTKAEKKQILLNRVMEAAAPLLAAEAKNGETDAQQFQKLSVQLEEAKQQMGEFLLAAGATDSLDTMSDALEGTIDDLERFDHWIKTIKSDWDAFINSLSATGLLSSVASGFNQVSDAIARFGVQIGTRRPFGAEETEARDIGRHRSVRKLPRAGSGSSLGDTPAAVNTKLLEAQRDYARELQDIHRDSAKQIADTTRDGARQRAEIIRDYEQTIVRETEDFNRQRARSQRDYEQSILDANRDAAEREAEMQEDLNRTLTRARQDSNERIAELEEDYAKNRQRRQEDHRDKLLSAAGRLDAIALLEERKRFARESKDAEEAHNEQIADERETLQESIDQANEAHREQLDDARKADRQRLEDMRADREQQLLDEDEDRRIRKERDAEDHRAQLESHDIAQAERITQIGEQAAEQRRQLQDAHNEQLYDLGEHTFAMGEKRREEYKLALELHRDHMKALHEQSMAMIRALPRSHPSEADPYTGRTTPTSTSSRSVGDVTIHIHGDGLNERQVANLVADYFEAI